MRNLPEKLNKVIDWILKEESYQEISDRISD